MKNYRYRVDGEDVILSGDEHETVKKEFAAGNSLIYLRNGSLAIGKGRISLVKETEQPTDQDEASRLATPHLGEPERDRRIFSREEHVKTYKKMGWEHGPGCLCERIDL